MARRRLGAAVGLIAVMLAACGTSSAQSPEHRSPTSSRRSAPNSTAGTPTTNPSSVHPTTTTDPRAALPEGPSSAVATTTTPTSSPASNAADMDSGHGVMRYAVGRTGTLWDPTDSVVLATISVSAPTFSTTDAQGDTPQFGYFATFTVTMTDIAPVATGDDVQPDSDDFYVQEPDGQLYGNGGQANVQDGNGFEAEQSNDLGTAPNGQPVNLVPGQSSTGTVTIDVPSEHGQLVYEGSDDNLVDGSWAY